MKRPAALAVFLLLGPAALLAVADELEDALERLKEAQTKSDPATVKKAASDVYTLTCEIKATPAPAADAEKEAWNQQMERAKAAEVLSEYALYTTAVQKDAATMIDLISTLEKQNPKSKYLDEGYGSYIVALTKSSGGAKLANATAEKALANFPQNEYLLFHVMNVAMAGKQPDRALSLANRLVAAMNRHSKPVTMQQSDWDRKRGALL